jgi:hypothetical protein
MIMAEPPTTQNQAPSPDASPNRPRTDGRLSQRRVLASDTVRLARLTALSGIVFSALFVVSVVLIYRTPRLSASDAEITAFYSGSSTLLVTVGLYLVPFAGIIFLWHAHATRLLIKSCTPAPSQFQRRRDVHPPAAGRTRATAWHPRRLRRAAGRRES